MSIFKRRPPFPTTIFIVAAISTLVTLPVLLVLFRTIILDSVKIDTSADMGNSVLVPTDDPLITKVASIYDNLKSPIISNVDPSIGPANAPVTIVEYSDYKCKFCQNQETTLKRIMSEYKDKVRLIWKDYPEKDTYSSAWMTNIAARCAGSQGQFWAYHDIIFKDNKNFGKIKAADIAARLKLDQKKFSDCLGDMEIVKQIQDNIKEANALNITGVPLIYVNGYDFLGEASLDDLRNVIKSELKNK